VLDYRLGNADPFALPDEDWEQKVTAKLLDDDPLSLSEVAALAAA